MHLRLLRKSIHRCFELFGFDIRRSATHFVDAFADQQRLLSANASVILDIGANVGDTVSIYRKLFPAATIYAFEPTDVAYAELSRNFAADSHVKLQKLAVGDREESRNMFLFANSVTNSLLEPEHHAGDVIGKPEMIEPRGTQQVQLTTVDLFCQRNNISRIDALKIDVQGAEMMVLNGAKGMLDKGAVRLIQTEVQFGSQYHGQTGYLELFTFMRDHNFELFGLYGLVRGGDRYLPFVDAIFLPRRANITSAKRSL